MQNSEGIITGRFAPTPSGPLHFGSLVTAVASYCHARSTNGRWLVRIEDLDTPRVVKGSADNILFTLERLGFEWDHQVLYQSQRFDVYQKYLNQLKQQGLLYACDCSRNNLLKKPHHRGPLGSIYPGHCRHKKLDIHSNKLRFLFDSTEAIKFKDNHYGTVQINLSKEVGDFIIKRLDGVFAYHLAVVVDDAYQQVNNIVRGADLLEASGIHLYLNDKLGFSNAEYLHIPLVKNKTGEKLSKQTGAKSLQLKNPGKQIIEALNFLGQNTPAELSSYQPAEILGYAVSHWDTAKIPESHSVS